MITHSHCLRIMEGIIAAAIIYMMNCFIENMIYKGLDDEEAGFLAFVVKQQAEQKALVNRREKEEVSAFKVSVWTNFVVISMSYYSNFTASDLLKYCNSFKESLIHCINIGCNNDRRNM